MCSQASTAPPRGRMRFGTLLPAPPPPHLSRLARALGVCAASRRIRARSAHLAEFRQGTAWAAPGRSALRIGGHRARTIGWWCHARTWLSWRRRRTFSLRRSTLPGASAASPATRRVSTTGRRTLTEKYATKVSACTMHRAAVPSRDAVRTQRAATGKALGLQVGGERADFVPRTSVVSPSAEALRRQKLAPQPKLLEEINS